MTIEFQEWPKTPRWYRDVVITEKIDGTNAGVQIIALDWDASTDREAARFYNQTGDGSEFLVIPQSRKRIITSDNDNAGFARWVEDNARHLISTLGEGVHFGEWWGQGIQRRYGLDHKRFSLFNTARWNDVLSVDPDYTGLAVVPTLYAGPLNAVDGSDPVRIVLEGLAASGSHAAPGFDRPEGVIVYHTAARQVFKALIENDDRPKSAPAPRPSLWDRLLRRAA